MRPIYGARLRGWLGASAFAAIVAAHALTYLLAAPSHHDRAQLLHETGHGSWTSMFIVAGAALLGGLIAFAARWASPDRPVSNRRLFSYAGKRLVPLQIAGFLVLECAERAFEHGSALSAVTEPLVLVGVFVQAVVALGCAFLLVAFTRLVRRLRTALVPAPSGDRILVPSHRSPHIPRSVARLAWNLRGPPLLPRSR